MKCMYVHQMQRQKQGSSAVLDNPLLSKRQRLASSLCSQSGTSLQLPQLLLSSGRKLLSILSSLVKNCCISQPSRWHIALAAVQAAAPQATATAVMSLTPLGDALGCLEQLS